MPRRRRDRTYPTDLSDPQWAELEPLLLPAKRPGPGRPRRVDLRRVLDGLLYLEHTGCQWRLLPKDFHSWGTVRYSFDRWTLDGTWERLHTVSSRGWKWLSRSLREGGGARSAPTPLGGGLAGGQDAGAQQRHHGGAVALPFEQLHSVDVPFDGAG